MSKDQVDLSDVYADIVVEFGRKEIPVKAARRMQVGDVIHLDKLAGEAFDLLVNGTNYAECEIVVVTDLMAVRLTRMVDPGVKSHFQLKRTDSCESVSPLLRAA